MKKILKNKIIFLLGVLCIFAFLIFPKQSEAAALLPGDISTCGELVAPGEYTLTTNLNGGSDTCLTISSDNVTITGDAFTISGTGDVAIDARKRSGEGTPLVDGGNAYTNLIVSDLNITGYTTGINLSGNSITSGIAGDAGDVSIFYSVVGSILANGGDSDDQSFGGIGGNVAFTDIDLDISNSTISVLGGEGTSGTNSNGGLDLNYSGTLSKDNVVLSALSFFNDNSAEYGSYPGGTWPITDTNLVACGTLMATTTKTFFLTQDITGIEGNCFSIYGNNVTIAGNGHSLVSATTSNTEFAISSVGYSNFTLASTTVTDFSNLINSASSVTITGDDIDLSNKYIAAGSLTITYDGTLDIEGATASALTSLTINGYNYGSRFSGPLLDWEIKTLDADRSWRAITSSADGTKLAAVVNNGQIYTSTDSGVTWTARDSNRSWWAITSSADGTKLAAVLSSGQIYTSTDSGVTWTAREFNRNWRAITSSADGTKLAAVVNNGQIYTSTDSGVTWTARNSNRAWTGIASSVDGTKLAATVSNGQIYTSTDSGVTWTARDSNRGWWAITSSADGTKLAAVVSSGQIYTSTDSGVTWTARDSNRNWRSISSSGDGTKLVAVVSSGRIYMSTDSGVNWTANESSRSWIAVTSSFDGTKLFAAVESSGRIFGYEDDEVAFDVNILVPATSTISSWDPMVSWGGATECQYSFDNWLSTSTADCSLLGSDIEDPGYGTSTLYLYGEDSDGNSATDEKTFLFPATGLTACGTLSASGIYTLSNNITGVVGSCFVVAANNVTIKGNGHTVTATTSNSSYAVRATSTASAYTNLTIEDITFSGFNGGGVDISGTISNVGGSGGSGGNVTVSSSTMGVINASGANYSGSGVPAHGGIAGNVSIINSSVGTITASGGNGVTWSGVGGSAGVISVISSTVTGNIVAAAGNGGSYGSAGRGGHALAISILNSNVTGSLTHTGGKGGNGFGDGIGGAGGNIDSITISTSTIGSDISHTSGTGGDGGNFGAPGTGGTVGSITINNSTTGIVTSRGGNGGSKTSWNTQHHAGANGAHGGSIVITNATTSHLYSIGGNGGNSPTRSGGLGGNSGNITVTNSTHGNILMTGGNGGNGAASPYAGGAGGNSNSTLTYSGSVVDLSGKSILGYGGAGGTGGTAGATGTSVSIISITYTTSFVDPDVHSPFASASLIGPTITRSGTNVASTTLLSSLPQSYSSSTEVDSCGTFSASGTYTLSQNITDVTGVCFIIAANNVTIDGAGYTVTAAGGNTSYAVTAGSSQNAVLENITFVGFGSGLISSSASVTYSGADVDLTNSTSSVSGTLTINYTNSLTLVNSFISTVSNFIINNVSLFNWTSGIVTWMFEDISSCQTISSPGIYNLTQNISNVPDTCFTVETDGVIINGNGYTISGGGGNNDFAILATKTDDNSYSKIGIRDLNIVGFGGGIDARGANGVTENTSGKVGGKISLYNVNFPIDTVSVNISGGDAFYENNATESGGAGGYLKVSSSTLGTVLANGGDTVGDTAAGFDNGTVDGGSPGTIEQTNSSIGAITANMGVGYIPGCIDDSYDNYNSDATYDDGSCMDLVPGVDSDNPEGNTISGPFDFYYYKNYGIVEGDANFYIYKSDYSEYNYDSGGNYGTTTGFVGFYDDWNGSNFGNHGYVGGGAYFDGYSENYGIIDGDVVFNYGSNHGVINGNVDFSNSGNSEAYNYGTVNGDATFYYPPYYNQYDYGTVTGTTYYYYGCMDPVASNYIPTAINDDGGCIYYGQNSDLPEGETYTGDLNFCGYYNYGTVIGNVTFSCGSGGNYGTVDGNAIFESGSYNYGTVTGDATFYDYFTGPDHDSSDNTLYVDGSFSDNGTGIVEGEVYDANLTLITTVQYMTGMNNSQVWSLTAVFNSDSYNSGAGIIYGDTTFNDSSTNGGLVSGNVVFNDTSYNTGDISGSALFNTTYYASTTPANGVFAFEDDGWEGSISGTVLGSDSNPIDLYEFYNSTVNSTTMETDMIFHDSSRNAGTVTGDVTLDTTYYSGSVPTTSTLIIANSSIWVGRVIGSLFASDGVTEITDYIFQDSAVNSGIIDGDVVFYDSSTNNGTINGDATYNNTSAFRIGTVNGTAILNGLNQIIQGANVVINFFKDLNSGRDTLFFSSGSSLTVSGLFTLLGTDANNLLSIRTTNPNSNATFNINGTTNWDFLRIKNITKSGSVLNLSTKTVFDDGNNSGFIFPSNSSSGSRGGVTSSYTPPSLPPSHGGEDPDETDPDTDPAPETDSNNNNGGGGSGTNYQFQNLFNDIDELDLDPIQEFSLFNPNGDSPFVPSQGGTTVIPAPFKDFKVQTPINFVSLPTNFMFNISTFLFAPLPSNISDALSSVSKLQGLAASVGLNNAQRLASLAVNPIKLTEITGDEIPPGYFVIKSGDHALTTYVTYDVGAGGVSELVKVSPNQSLSISLIPLSTGEVTATYLDQVLKFEGSESVTAYIVTPTEAGRYVLKTASSPIPLLIEVVAPYKQEEMPGFKPWGIFNFFWKWFN